MFRPGYESQGEEFFKTQDERVNNDIEIIENPENRKSSNIQ